MKTYRGAPAAARNYVESDRGRADDYYLAEGPGVALRFSAGAAGRVAAEAALYGDAYEAWVAGVDPVTGAPRGRLRCDDKAVRFVEVVINGPKSWSLAAELHPDISAAYDAAQDRAAEQIIAWLGQHATTRVGPRGGQVQIPLERLEAVTVRHHTSRAGDPHRHLHLQLNARVFAAGAWRGLHTVGVRDSLDAINGIGHAAVMTDPAFRAALAAHGFTLDLATGEVQQLAPYVGPFSARAAQIARNLDQLEADWRAAHPGQAPGPALRRSWDALAWAQDRPDKVHGVSGSVLRGRWLRTLADLGYHPPQQAPTSGGPRRPGPSKPGSGWWVSVGTLDRDQAVDEVLARLAARRSGWNAADVRGEVEQLLARRGLIAAASVRAELAEDLTARTVEACVPLLERPGIPEHFRALTSRHVLEVEAELAGRLAARGTTDSRRAAATSQAEAGRVVGRALDPTQAVAARLLAGREQLVLIEGAAGAGKTTTLAAARDLLAAQGRRLTVVTPTLQAAQVAQAELDDTTGNARSRRASKAQTSRVAMTGSAAALVFAHGFRWDEHGRWTRLHPGQLDPHTGHVYPGPPAGAVLRAKDLLVIDEAGMLDQDTARALLTVADEQRVRVALLGDRHQLSAVGRGGLLELAARWADPAAQVTLDGVHRFTRTTATPGGGQLVEPDTDYARISLALRTGDQPEQTFQALLDRGQIRLHASETDRITALADLAAADPSKSRDGGTVVVADTREQVRQLNAAIRDRHVAAGRVDDRHSVVTGASERIGIGDRVVTRRNDPALLVANRDSWTVAGITGDGGLALVSAQGRRIVPTAYVAAYVELGYASTVHGVQGQTATTAHLALGEHTGAASAYVALTRGRETNIAHLVAATEDEAQQQWVAAFARDRADLGPAHAARRAEHEAADYARTRPVAEVLAELRTAWTREQRLLDQLDQAQHAADLLREIIDLRTRREHTTAPLRDTVRLAQQRHRDAAARADAATTALRAATRRHLAALQADWDQQRPAAHLCALAVEAGPGRLGQHRRQVTAARHQLTEWADRWRPDHPALPAEPAALLRYALTQQTTADIDRALTPAAEQRAARQHPERDQLHAAARTARTELDRAFDALDAAARGTDQQLAALPPISDPQQRLDDLDHARRNARSVLDAARHRIEQLQRDPALLTNPERLETARTDWQLQHTHELQRRTARPTQAPLGTARHHEHELVLGRPDDGPSL